MYSSMYIAINVYHGKNIHTPYAKSTVQYGLNSVSIMDSHDRVEVFCKFMTLLFTEIMFSMNFNESNYLWKRSLFPSLPWRTRTQLFLDRSKLYDIWVRLGAKIRVHTRNDHFQNLTWLFILVLIYVLRLYYINNCDNEIDESCAERHIRIDGLFRDHSG